MTIKRMIKKRKRWENIAIRGWRKWKRGREKKRPRRSGRRRGIKGRGVVNGRKKRTGKKEM